MNTAPFEIIPAWRIARLRAALRDAEQRGANPDDEGHDLTHRALQRRFALARGRADNVRRLASRPKTTRKGHSFPHLKLVIIWRAILNCRPLAWRPGDTAPFGSIRRAHDQAVVACRAAGIVAYHRRTSWRRCKLNIQTRQGNLPGSGMKVPLPAFMAGPHSIAALMVQSSLPLILSQLLSPVHRLQGPSSVASPCLSGPSPRLKVQGSATQRVSLRSHTAV